MAIPAVYFLSIVPAWLTGRRLSDLLLIYLNQATKYDALTMSAPTMYAWFNSNAPDQYFIPGLVFAASIVFLYIVLGYKSRIKLAAPTIVQLALISALIVPFFLPRMHDRYFYPADVLSIVYGFFFPQYFFVPLLVNLSSFFTYQIYLFNMNPPNIPLPILALVLLLTIVTIVRHFILSSFPASNSQVEVSQRNADV
jgi:Gpi18-like mannosyltransferase